MNTESAALSRKLEISAGRIEAVISMLDEGATVPFISRYRKERTGGLDEVAVRDIQLELEKFRTLEKRKAAIIESIENSGLMTAELMKKIESCNESTALEDLYAPFKPKRRTRATIAREKGLEGLARIIMSGRTEPRKAAVRFAATSCGGDVEDALAGASDIIAEWASESIRLRNALRRTFRREASLKASVAKGKENDERLATYRNYLEFDRPLRSVISHQYLALRRAEEEGLLRLRYTLADEKNTAGAIAAMFVPEQACDEAAEVIRAAATDAFSRLLKPSIENEIAAAMKEQADTDAIALFSSNLRQLLMAPPLRGKAVLAIDPGFRTGCKVVCLDSNGRLLDDTVIYPTPPRSDIAGAACTLRRLISIHGIEAIALGNGTASRETGEFLRNEGIMPREALNMVNENGASIYSASDIAREEFPDKDVTVRGAVSIGRRLIDPLAELVKIDPKSIGVGQYQHDVDHTRLKDALDYTVMSCVNAVGVDLNTASPRLLSYISGIGPQLASNIVAYRDANGPFRRRSALMKVPRLGAKAFEQAAGFLRINDGDNPLDSTGIHPETYAAVENFARSRKKDIASLIADKEFLKTLSADEISECTGIGHETASDIIAELIKPGRDPRTEAAEAAAFSSDIKNFEDLHEGMHVDGVVNNITAFGAFVNIGIKENALIHISQLADRHVAAVNDVLSIGQKISARIIEIDFERRRIGLSMKNMPRK